MLGSGFSATRGEFTQPRVLLSRASFEDAARRLVRARQRSAWRTRRGGPGCGNNDHVDMIRLRRAFPTEGSMDMIRL